MTAGGGIKYLQLGDMYLLKHLEYDNAYFAIQDVTESRDLYAQIGVVDDDRKCVLFDKNMQELDLKPLFQDIDWNDYTAFFENYNGQTVYFESDPFDVNFDPISTIP